jgi:hypothetical protein
VLLRSCPGNVPSIATNVQISEVLVSNNSLERACSLPWCRVWLRAGILAATRGQPTRQAAQFNR